jgi:hypothetical protein
MYRDKITLEHALSLAETGEITIVSTLDDNSYHPRASEFYTNYITLKSKARYIQTDRIFNYFPAFYSIEIPVHVDENTMEWYYLYGIQNLEIKNKTKDNIEYVYILTNPGYSDLVKIGMTERNVSTRAKWINGAGVLTEWVPKFALPVAKGSAYKIEQQMHKLFAESRVDSDQGHEREFFRLNPLTAFDKLREIGALHQVGDPIVY